MQNFSIKDGLKYKDISWLMPSVDVESVLVRLGVKPEGKSKNTVRALCPDHHLYIGKNSSDPNWFVNVDTGETFCHTEGRSSNLLWTVRRLFDCSPKEAAKFLLGVESDIDMLNIDLIAMRHKIEQLKSSYEKEVLEVRGLDIINQDMNKRYMSEAAYRFFIHPPEKKYPTNISRSTVDKYRIFERTWGYYSNCVIVPFMLNNKLVGFCAIDILGKREWIRIHPTRPEKEYRKVRYPLNFLSGEYLFGYDDCVKGANFLIIVEGPREVMKLWQEGFTNAVAILGSHLSGEQEKMITSLGPKKIVLMFDGDDAGVDTTTKVGKKLSTIFAGDSLKKCFLPRGRDPKTLDYDDLKRLIL